MRVQILSIADITIPSHRQRKDLGDLSELMASIQTHGLINAIAVSEDAGHYTLIAGERRLNACHKLGMSTIPAHVMQEIDRIDHLLLELDENDKRADLTWQERCLALDHIHNELCDLDPTWTAARTAKRSGVSPATISQDLAIAAELKSENRKVWDAPAYSTARNIVTRLKARRADAELDNIGISLATPAAPATAPQSEGRSPAPTPRSTPAALPFINLSMQEWSRVYTGPPFNFLHCDFPYGIDVGAGEKAGAARFETYEDSFENYKGLLDNLESMMARQISDRAHMIFWFSMRHYEFTRIRLESMGWTVLHTPLIWHKSNHHGTLPDPNRGPRWIYETAFFCTRGDKFVVSAVDNHFSAPNVKTIHMSEKPIEMLSHFMRMCVDETSAVLDPTCGSGNALIAAKRLKASRVLGLEIDPAFYKDACARWQLSQN